ncbi:hypothetical protein [Paraburkholderia sp. BCC1876]|uniref:hypothetical protein n=1 Tax=Paraburkholderia sp. BCC1876 TaxID=2676303 RepID=UPI00159249FE|nr:hypothetical protein [Paraburkholderia sp. BCC1876]
MWVRVVAAALAVWCVSGAAMAAGYAETWNPPEATGHAAKQAGKTKKVGKVKASGGSKAGSKAGAKVASSKTASKTASRHTASGQHGAQRVASASVTGKGGKPATRGAVKKVTARNGSAKGTVKALGTAGSKPRKPKAAVMAQGKKPHAQLVTAKSGQGKVTYANLVQGHATRPHAAKVAAKSAATKPAVAQANAPAQNANVSASPAAMAATSSNPATAGSGSLPPILH